MLAFQYRHRHPLGAMCRDPSSDGLSSWWVLSMPSCIFPALFLPPKQFRSSSFYFSFLSRVKMNSTNWPAPNVWVFIAQLVERCSVNAEAMGSNPVEVPKFFSQVNLQFPILQLPLQRSYLHLNLYFRVFPLFTSSSKPCVLCYFFVGAP